ncbi:hypothetical protein ACIGXM_34030 [Kitasatospora sp. NPDC052896]|uniref:hypothetical protein n=1 Tax=Kitasatospora sp. NPDC052896 TaxID=3364061 RepID=UPI0037CC6E0E
MGASASQFSRPAASGLERQLRQLAQGLARQDAAARITELLVAERPAFRVRTSEAARAFTAVKPADLDGSAVQALTGARIAQGRQRREASTALPGALREDPPRRPDRLDLPCPHRGTGRERVSAAG